MRKFLTYSLLLLTLLATPATAAKLGEDGLHKQPWFTVTFKDLKEDIAAAKKDRRQAQALALARRGLQMMLPQGAPTDMFAEGGEVRGYAAAGVVGMPGAPKAADEGVLAQYNLDPASLMAQQQGLGALMPQQSKYSDLMLQDIDQRRSEDYLKNERKQAANNALMNFGLALMATKNPNFLGALGESGAPAADSS